MRPGFVSLATLKAYLTGQSTHSCRHGTWSIRSFSSDSVTIGSRHFTSACRARARTETCTHPSVGSHCSARSGRAACVHVRLSSKAASVWPSPGKAGESPTRAARPNRTKKRRRRSKRKSNSDAKASEGKGNSATALPPQQTHGVIDFLLRGTSIASPAGSSPTSLANSNALPSLGRSRLARGRPDAPLPSSSPEKPSTVGNAKPDPKARVPRSAARPISKPPSTLKPTAPSQHHPTFPVTPVVPPWHCALWRVMQHVPVPIQGAAVSAFSLLRLVMPLPGHYASPQPALTAHNAKSVLPESPGGSWPIELGSVTAAAGEQARGFPHSASGMKSAEHAFEASWKLDKLAAERYLPQAHSDQLMSAIRQSLPAVVHAAKSNTVALKVVDCAGSLLRAVEKWPSADEKVKVAAELHRVASLAATHNLAAFPISRLRSKSRAECTEAFDHCANLCLAVARSSTHVPACDQAPRLLWLALQGGFGNARGRIETLPLPRATLLLQTLAALGTTCSYSKKLVSLVVRQAPSAINAAVAESLRCMRPQPLAQLTWWDWVRFYAPAMGLWGGVCAASMAPAPLQHTRGLAVLVQPHPHSRAAHAGVLRSLSVPTAASYRDRRCLPWSVHAAAGPQPVVDSITLLLHALLTVRLCQAGTDDSDALSPDAFAQKVRAVISNLDKQAFVSAYAALAAFPGQRPLFPHRLLMVDRVARSLHLLDNPLSPWTAAQAHGQAQASDAAQGAADPVAPGAGAARVASRARRKWAALGVAPELFDTPEAVSLRLACLQRTDPEQPSLRVELERALEVLRRNESSRGEACCLKRLKHVPQDATDEDVVRAVISAKRAVGDDQGKCAGLVSRMRIGMAPWLCARVAETPTSVRFGSLLLRLAAPGQFPDEYQSMSNEDLAASLQRLVGRGSRSHGSRALASCHQALCQALQAASLHVSLQRLAPAQQVAFLRLLEGDERCADVTQHLRPGRKSEGTMRGLLKLLNTQPLPVHAYQALRELSCSAAEVPAQKGHQQLTGASADVDGATKGSLWADLQALMQQAAEVARAAGHGKPVAGCQVTKELQEMARHVRPQALKQGALALPPEMEEWSSATVKSARGTPSELQKKIHSGLQVMGFSVIHEHQVGTLPMHLDIVTKGRGKNGEQRTVAVEVDGPSHFVHTAAGPHSLNSATRFRNAALLLHHVHVVPVSYTVWDRVGISGQGLHHEVNQQSWLRSEMLKRGVVFPVRVTQ